MEQGEDESSSGSLPVRSEEAASSAHVSAPTSLLANLRSRLPASSADHNPWAAPALSSAVLAFVLIVSAAVVPGHPVALVAASGVCWLVAAVLGSWGWYRRSLFVSSGVGCLAALGLALLTAAAVAVLGIRTFSGQVEAAGLLAVGVTLAGLVWSSAAEARRGVRLALTGAAVVVALPAIVNAAMTLGGCPEGQTWGSCRSTYVPWTAVAAPELFEGQEVPSLLVESAPDGWFSSEMYEVAVIAKRGLDDGTIRFDESGALVTSAGSSASESIYLSFAAPLQWMCITDGTWVYDTYAAKVFPAGEDSADLPGRECDENYPDLPTWQDYPPPQVAQLSPLIPVVNFLRKALAAGEVTGEVGGVLTAPSEVMDTRGYSGWYQSDGIFCVTDGATVYSTQTGKFIAGSSC